MRELLDPHDKTISKTKRKQASRDLQQLGDELAGLPADKLANLELDSELQNAIEQLRSIKSHIARKRQMLFVGKLLRARNVESLVEAIEQQKQQSKAVVASHHRAERWRDELLSQGDAALQKLIEDRNDLDRQQLRTMLRQAAQQQQANKPPVAARKLYRLLHQADQNCELPEL